MIPSISRTANCRTILEQSSADTRVKRPLNNSRSRSARINLTSYRRDVWNVNHVRQDDLNEPAWTRCENGRSIKLLIKAGVLNSQSDVETREKRKYLSSHKLPSRRETAGFKTKEKYVPSLRELRLFLRINHNDRLNTQRQG